MVRNARGHRGRYPQTSVNAPLVTRDERILAYGAAGHASVLAA